MNWTKNMFKWLQKYMKVYLASSTRRSSNPELPDQTINQLIKNTKNLCKLSQKIVIQRVTFKLPDSFLLIYSVVYFKKDFRPELR